MWTIYYLVVFLAAFSVCLGDFHNTQYCSGWKPQQTIDIEQVQGLWYVQEKILHHERSRFTRIPGSCPTVFISHDYSISVPTSTSNPLYNDFDGSSYGSGYPHFTDSTYNNYNSMDRDRSPYIPNANNEQDFLKMKEEYDKRTTYSNDHPRWRQGQNMGYSGGGLLFNPNFLNRYLRLHWDDSTSTEYRLRYNLTRPTMWFHMGRGGPSQEYDMHNIQGIVQVTKAVGNHLVLTFCHNRGSGRQPELYTAILSREKYFPEREITGVHTILIDRDLQTSAVEKLCSGGNGLKISRMSLIYGISLFIIYTCLLTRL